MIREQFTSVITGENLAQAVKRLHEKCLGLVAETRALIDNWGCLNEPLKASPDELQAQLEYNKE